MIAFGLVDALVVFGAAVILPLALGGRRTAWAVAAASATLAVLMPTGTPAGLLASVWVVVVAMAIVSPGPAARPPIDPLVRLLAGGYAAVAGGALVASCLGYELFGVGQPIVELTVTHFTYAGAAALVLAGRNHRARPTRLTGLALAATGCAPPLVGIGFVTGAAVAQVGGAVLMAIGVWSTCAVHLGYARRLPRGPARRLFAVSGVSALAPMVLAVSWAAGQHWAVPALSIADMERAHGLVNALGFVLCGLLAERVLAHAAAPGPEPVGTRQLSAEVTR